MIHIQGSRNISPRRLPRKGIRRLEKIEKRLLKQPDSLTAEVIGVHHQHHVTAMG
jgi:hypothetical protein